MADHDEAINPWFIGDGVLVRYGPGYNTERSIVHIRPLWDHTHQRGYEVDLHIGVPGGDNESRRTATFGSLPEAVTIGDLWITELHHDAKKT
jgi:hypothetical protein